METDNEQGKRRQGPSALHGVIMAVAVILLGLAMIWRCG